MNLEYINQRVREMFNYLEALKDAANEDTVSANNLLAKLKEENDEPTKMDLIKQFKKIQFFNNFKLMESEKVIPALIEAINLAKVLGLEIELSDDEEAMLDVNKKRFAPMYVLDKGTMIFMNKDLEEMIDKELEKPSATDVQAITNILNVVNGNKK